MVQGGSEHIIIRLGIYTVFSPKARFLFDWACIRLGIYTFFAPQAQNFENPYIKCVDLDRRRRKKIGLGIYNNIRLSIYTVFSKNEKKVLKLGIYIYIDTIICSLPPVL